LDGTGSNEDGSSVITPMDRRFHVRGLWVMTPCNFAAGLTARSPYNVSVLTQHYTASQPRRPRLGSLPPWRPQISHSIELYSRGTRFTSLPTIGYPDWIFTGFP